MKTFIFTTPTKHHTYFINTIYKEFDINGIIYEKKIPAGKASAEASFDKEQDEYEELFFDKSSGGVKRDLEGKLAARVRVFENINQKEADSYVRSQVPDLVIVFGTGIIYPNIINIPRQGMINLHGGLTQYYRGLDSTLWAFYEKNFDKLGVTIHYVDPRIDTGDILAQERIQITKNDEVFHFRYKITKEVTRLTMDLLRKFIGQKGSLPGVKLNPKGKYLSAMDLKKKMVAFENFKSYRSTL